MLKRAQQLADWIIYFWRKRIFVKLRDYREMFQTELSGELLQFRNNYAGKF